MKEPLFSIIIPTFNARDDLQRSLDSVFVQDDADYEIWVIDGASTDGTRELLESYGDCVRWLSESDSGVYDAMNKGIERASGDWLYFLGAGDLLRLDVLCEIAPHARELADESGGVAALIYGDVWLCEEQQRFGGSFPPARLRSWNPSHQAIFTSRAVFEKLGGYETRYLTAADYAFNLACWGEEAIVKKYVPLVIADYKGGGLSVTRPDVAFERDKLGLIRRHLGARAYWLRRLESAMPTPLKQLRLAVLRRLRG